MLNVGLTGNVAAGKSTVVRWFAEWGATVIDADELVRKVQRPGSPVVTTIAQRFGDRVLHADGSLDRAALRNAVMGDDDALATLNAIVHPAVRRERARRAAAAEARGDCILINDIPLLFEVLDQADFDLVVLVDAATDIRRSRLTSRRGLSLEEAERLIAAQLPSERKRARSDIVLDNDGSLHALKQAAWQAWERVRARAASKSAGGGDPILVVFARQGDESLLTGGTLARYADAGNAVHLVLTGEGGSFVREAATLLGLRGIVPLGFDDRRLASDEGQVARSVVDVLERVAPAVVITYGADGVDGDPTRRAVHSLACRACASLTASPTTYFVTFSEAEARRLSPALQGTRPEGIVARLDVRPWRDRKGAAIKAYEGTLPLAQNSAAWVALERESYGSLGAVRHTITDLFATTARPS